MRIVPFALASLLALAGAAHADGKFHPIPGGKSKLALRVVQYDGAVNGELTVEIRNRSGRAERFTAQGLYFVPDGDPDQAPQRLGAVGPILAGDKQEDAISVPAGGKVTVKLDVFCVDDHRDAPTAETPFTLARHRMPRQLAETIDREGRAAAKEAGGFAEPDALDPVQEQVWKARDKKWVKLDGEGAQESAKSHPHHDDDRHEKMLEPDREPMPDELPQK